jgi:protoheme IX farnesyltransferase
MWLKRSTPQNIVIGGAAGAFPPMIGWACVTNSITLDSAILFLIIFLWTPPHFWALALFKKGDYGTARVPMLPNVAGVAATKRQIFAYSIPMALSGLAPAVLGFASPAYGAVAAVLGGIFVWRAWQTARMPDDDAKMIPAK